MWFCSSLSEDSSQSTQGISPCPCWPRRAHQTNTGSVPNFSWQCHRKSIPQPGKWGKSSSCSPWRWEAKKSRMDGLQGQRWSTKGGQWASSPRSTEALPSSFLKKEISSKETEQQRLKLDPTSWIPSALIRWVKMTKPKHQQNRVTKLKKPPHSVLTLYSRKWQQAANRWFPATKKKKSPWKARI